MQSAYADIPRTPQGTGKEGPDTFAADMIGRENEKRRWLGKHDHLALMGLDRWEDFGRADGTLSTRAMLPTGQAWTIGTAGFGTTPFDASPVIRNGVLYYDTPGATYVRVPGSDYSRLTAAFSFGAGTTFGAVATLVMSKKAVSDPQVGANGIATNSIHASFGPDPASTAQWNVGIFDGVALRKFASDTLDRKYAVLAADQVYEAAIERTGVDRLRIHLPDGTTVDTTDAIIQSRTGLPLRIDDWWGPTALIEHYQPDTSFSTDRRPAFHGVGVSGRAAGMPVHFGVPRKVGQWVFGGIAPANSASTLDWLYLMPVLLNERTTFDLATLNVTTAAAGAVARGAVYADNGTYYPGRRLWTGSFDAAVAGAPEVAAAFTASPGVVWLGVVAQVAAPSLTFTFGVPFPVPAMAKPTNGYAGTLVVSGVTGEPPATFPTAGVVGFTGAPRLSLRMA